MTFTVLLPTRNRPALLQKALASVLAQRVDGLEVVVIDDGTTEPFAAALAAIEAAADRRVRFLHLPTRADGHGPSLALNFGAAAARGRYLCFLDDDDEWTDPHHLAQAAGLIDGADPVPDVLYFDQRAFRNGAPVERAIWLEDLAPRLARHAAPRPDGAWSVSPADLLQARGFCHVNTTIVRHAFFDEIGGFDDALRYEGDREFYLRSIDRAQAMLYVPRVVARHNIPDPTRRDNMSTLVSEIGKRAFQITLLEKTAGTARHEAVRAYARRHLGYARKHIALALYRAGQYRAARQHALAALGTAGNPKWLAFCLWISLRALLGERRTG